MDNDFVEETGGNELVVLDAENSNLTSKSKENEKLDITEPEKSLKRYFYYQRGSDQALSRIYNARRFRLKGDHAKMQLFLHFDFDFDKEMK